MKKPRESFRSQDAKMSTWMVIIRKGPELHSVGVEKKQFARALGHL